MRENPSSPKAIILPPLSSSFSSCFTNLPRCDKSCKFNLEIIALALKADKVSALLLACSLLILQDFSIPTWLELLLGSGQYLFYKVFGTFVGHLQMASWPPSKLSYCCSRTNAVILKVFISPLCSKLHLSSTKLVLPFPNSF